VDTTPAVSSEAAATSAPAPSPGGIGPGPHVHHEFVSYCIHEVVAKEEARQARERQVRQVDTYLAGSPMANLGECIVANAERTGVNYALCPAIAQAESSKGRVCPPYNAWGMGPGMSFSSWEHGVERFFNNVLSHWGPAQSAHELVNPDYCCPPYPWCNNVEGQAEHIRSLP